MRADCAPSTRKYLWERKAPHRSAKRQRKREKRDKLRNTSAKRKLQLHQKDNHRFLCLVVSYRKKIPPFLIDSLLVTSLTLILKIEVTKKTFKMVNWYIYAMKEKPLCSITLCYQ